MLKTIGTVSKETRVCLTPVNVPDGVGTYLQYRDPLGRNYLSPGNPDDNRSPVSDPSLCVANPNP